MLATVTNVLTRNVMADDRKRIRLTEAAKRIGVATTYLARLARAGTLDKEGLTVHRPYPDVVEFDEAEFDQWTATHYAKRRRPR